MTGSEQTTTGTPPTTEAAAARELWAKWNALWNGELDLSRADEVIADKFTVHGTSLAGRMKTAAIDEIRDRDGLVSWIVRTRAALEDLHFTDEPGPIVDGDLVAGRYRATAVHRGGTPGATAAIGTATEHVGMNILRIENGRFAEYWTVADTLGLLTQLGVITS
ncbi:ester cyclase [Streptomyces sp. RY43-2]|uniref:Ester cyclase n=1 Tax=Streptomyces macrolidinus TaxID=2952607 RepID=A0ABT0ZMP0_9ACTN|nr:ester cyclase [Streptomyces macrolidinus]MCN9244850.1 ester cyclase [Streptomyces macrolidinus]